MADSYKSGKLLISFHLFFFFSASFGLVSRVFVMSESVPPVGEDPENHLDARVVSPDRQQVQLERLEKLVNSLGDIVNRLESRSSEFYHSHEKRIHKDDVRFVSPSLLPLQEIHEREFYDEIDSDAVDVKSRGVVQSNGKSVTKYRPFWTERFRFVSAVRLDSNVTCIDVLPLRDFEGHRKYVAAGNGRGKIYVLHRNGDVALEFQTSTHSSIAVILSYTSVHKNECVMITGHTNGIILMHKVWEQSNGEEWSFLQMETLGYCAPSISGKDESHQISILEVHHVGRLRYILSINAMGKIMVFRENGTLYGSAVPKRRPLAFLKQRLLFLTENGAGSLDLRTMKLKETECEGLNHSIAKNYIFDAAERSKAYGFTSNGDLIHVLLLGDIMNFKCRVRSKKKLDMVEPLVFHSIKGYLFIVNQEKVSIYNVSSSKHYIRTGTPRFIISADLNGIRSSFLNYMDMDKSPNRQRIRILPLIASDQEKLVVLSLGDGYIGTYQSNLPLFKSEYGTILWSSPVLFFILFLLVAWLLLARKKEALISLGSDDPGSGDRSFTDPSRNADSMDVNGGGLRGIFRRHASSPHYGSGESNFRPGSDNHKAIRVTSADPKFGQSSEMKFRGERI